MLGAGRYFHHIHEKWVKKGLKPSHPTTSEDLVREFGSELPGKNYGERLEYASTVVANFIEYGLKQAS